ncbi:TPA: ABC transporter transmembrane domain-containing protein [Streptococcus suis]
MRVKNQKGIIFQLLSISHVTFSQLVVLIILMLLGAVLGTLQPIFLGKIVDSLSMPDLQRFWLVMIWMGAVFALSLVLTVIKDRFAATLAVKSENNIREKIVSSLLSNDVEIEKGSLPILLEEDAKVVSNLIFQHLEVVSDLLSILITLILMFLIEVRLSLLILFLLPLQFLCLSYFGQLLARGENKVKAGKENYLRHALESMVGRKNILVFDRQSERLKEFSYLNKSFGNSKFMYFMTQTVQANVLQSLFFLYNVILLIGGIYLIRSGELTIGLFISYLTYSNGLLSSGFSLAEWNNAYQTMKISLARLQGCISDYKNVHSEIDNHLQIKEFDVKGLSYSISGKQIFCNQNMSFKHGKLHLVQSPSGRGKTTLFNILSGMIQPESGHFIVNSRNVMTLPKQNIAYMLQENYLFSLSIFDNLCFYNSDLEIDEVKRMCKLLGINDWIEELENGYRTIVSAEDTRLSGGQVQLLCLARTLLKKADIYLLDEPLSSIDRDRKNHVLSYLIELSQRAIVLVNSHDAIAKDRNIKIVDFGVQ